MEEQSKYDKLRKKYQVLKQQVGVLKDALEKRQSEFNLLQVTHKDLQSKYQQNLEDLDVYKYKEITLLREIEELTLQIEQYKQSDYRKNDRGTPSQPLTRISGGGLLTGFLQTNVAGGINTQIKDNVDKLENKIQSLEEELELKIQENEELHMREFEIKKEYQSLVEKGENKQELLSKEIQDLYNEREDLRNHLNNLKCRISQLSDNEKDYKAKIESIQVRLNVLEGVHETKVKTLRSFIHDNIDEMFSEFQTWIHKRNSSYCFRKAVLIVFIEKNITKLISIIQEWRKAVLFYVKSEEINEMHTKILNSILTSSESGLNSLIKGFWFDKCTEFVCFTDEYTYLKLTCSRDFFSANLKEAFDNIHKALRLQCLILSSFKKNTEKLESFEYTKFEELLYVIRKLISNFKSLHCLINFVFHIGVNPDLLSLNRENSLSSLYLRLLECLNLKELDEEFPENKKLCINLIFNILKTVDISPSDIYIDDCPVLERILEIYNRILEIEKRRFKIHKRAIEYLFRNIRHINDLFEQLQSVTNWFCNNSSNKYFVPLLKDSPESQSSFQTYLSQYLLYISKKMNSKKDIERLFINLYQPSSALCGSEKILSSYQIVMRDSQSQLLDTLKLAENNMLNLNKTDDNLDTEKKQSDIIIDNLKSESQDHIEILNSNLENENLTKSDMIKKSIKIEEYNSENPEIHCNSKEIEFNNLISIDLHTQEVYDSLLKEANETLEQTVKRLQIRIQDLTDDIDVTRKSYEQQIAALSQHICSISDRLIQADALIASSHNQDILCGLCDTWCKLGILIDETKGICPRCRIRILRTK
ncbi:hypothetical protein cand_030340 [Cryptosporidium andersoni]|uniref:Protein phosphatase 1 regulatory subunit 21 C-terminal domain-containing protein n=1 Tax=Cryptosporidium andersoni TaxID=117008 RepID=A0A1J4MSC0_9CRYT|nr:hypothetical protein cand_030340 [Cryptosporidium andersoni]